jgi:hypothetical protein
MQGSGRRVPGGSGRDINSAARKGINRLFRKKRSRGRRGETSCKSSWSV